MKSKVWVRIDTLDSTIHKEKIVEDGMYNDGLKVEAYGARWVIQDTVKGFTYGPYPTEQAAEYELDVRRGWTQ